MFGNVVVLHTSSVERHKNKRLAGAKITLEELFIPIRDFWAPNFVIYGFNQ
jgi:hypothetical protein